jgi:hypothetical protein
LSTVRLRGGPTAANGISGSWTGFGSTKDFAEKIFENIYLMFRLFVIYVQKQLTLCKISKGFAESSISILVLAEYHHLILFIGLQIINCPLHSRVIDNFHGTPFRRFNFAIPNVIVNVGPDITWKMVKKEAF